MLIALIAFLSITPLTLAWDWQTHPRIAQKSVEALPLEVQNKINMTLVHQGSIDPDSVFHDNVHHHYPPAYDKATHWLNITKIAWKKEDYNNASYAFGVASHYISDSFATPHYIAKEPSWLHSKYEKQPNQFEIQTACSNKKINIKERLEQESNKEYLWSVWLEEYDPSIPQGQVEKATELMYSVALETFETTCNPPTSIVEDKSIMNGLPKYPIIGILLISITSTIVIRKSKWFKE